jgi:hypothetical protein
LSTAARRRRARCRAGSCSSLALSLSKSNRVATGPNPNPDPDPDAPGQSAAPNLTRLQAFSDVKQSSEAEPQTDQGTALNLSPAARCRKQKGRRPRAEEGYLGTWPSALGPQRLALGAWPFRLKRLVAADLPVAGALAALGTEVRDDLGIPGERHARSVVAPARARRSARARIPGTVYLIQT